VAKHLNQTGEGRGMELFNTMPVNRRAKKALQEIKEEQRADTPYCVQLAVSVLNRGEIEAEEDVVETIKAMMDWRPERIMNFFMIAHGEEYNPPGWEKGDYKELAKIVLDDIEEKMVRHFPWYRSGEE
jgi:hypothetical protein